MNSKKKKKNHLIISHSMFRNFFTPEQVDISPDYLIDMAADQWISTSL